MSFSDPINDMLNRIRNAHAAGYMQVDVPHSKLKEQIVKVLQREGYLISHSVEGEGVKKCLRLVLKYYGRGQTAIKGMKRLSKPGLRRYARADTMPRIKGGLGTIIVSTSAGILTGREAQKRKLGGEIICSIW